MNSKKTAAVVIRQLEKNTGASRNALEQARLLKKCGFKVDIIGQYINQKRVRESGARPIIVRTWFRKGYSRRLNFEKKVSRILNKQKYSLVFGHGDNFQQDVLFPHNCVHLAHELVKGGVLDPSDSVGRIHKELFQKGSFKHVVANSYLMKNDLIKRFRMNPEIIDVVHPGFSLEQFDSSKKEKWRKDKRAELSVSKDQVLVGLVTSGAFEKRNVDLFIRALAALSPEIRRKCKFLVVGKDPREDQYKDLASSLGIENLLFLGMVKDVEKIYSALDFSVLPGKWEEFGRVVVEAMGIGLPVICSDKVGASEILEDSSRQLIFESDNIDQLVERMEKLASDKMFRKEISKLNSLTALKYSEKAQAEKLVSILKQKKFI